MFGGPELQLPLLEARDAGCAPVAVTDDDAVADVVEELVPVVLLVSRGAAYADGRISVVDGSRATPFRTPRASASSVPISTAFSPTSSTSWMLVGMAW